MEYEIAKGMDTSSPLCVFLLIFFFFTQKKFKWERKREETFFVIKQTFQSLHKVHTKPSFHTHIFQLIKFFLAVLYSLSCLYAFGKKKSKKNKNKTCEERWGGETNEATNRRKIIIENMLISEFAAFGQIIKKRSINGL